MIKVLLNSKEINLDGALELNNKKIFYIDELDLDSKVQINITNGTKFISQLVDNDVSIEFTDKDGNVIQLILKNLSDILVQNNGTELVNITNLDNNQVMASISDLGNATTAAAAGGANENANANAQNLKNPELTLNLETLVQQLLENRNPNVYENGRLEQNLPEVNLPTAPGILRNVIDDNNAPVLEALETLNLFEDGKFTNINITNENGAINIEILNPNVIALYKENPTDFTNYLKIIILDLISASSSTNLIVIDTVNDNSVALEITVTRSGNNFPLNLSDIQLTILNNIILSNPSLLNNQIIGQATATDLDGDNLTYSAPTTAGFTLNPTTGVYTFNPSDEEYQSLSQGQQSTITIPVTVTDGNGGSDTQNLVINMTGTNDTPVVTDQSFTGDTNRIFESSLENADQEFLNNLKFDGVVAGRDFTFEIVNPTAISLYDSLNIETLIKRVVENSLNTSKVDITTTKVDGVLKVEVSIPEYSGDLSASQILTSSTFNNAISQNFNGQFNLNLENSVFKGKINASDVDVNDTLAYKFNSINSVTITTSNKFFATLFEKANELDESDLSSFKEFVNSFLPENVSLSGNLQDSIRDVATNTEEFNFSLVDQEKTITVDNTNNALSYLQASGLLVVNIDENSGDYIVYSPLFNTMKETDTLSVSFDYEVTDNNIQNPVKGNTTVEIQGENDAPIAFDDTVNTELNSSSYEDTLPGAYTIDMYKNVSISTDINKIQEKITTDVKSELNVDVMLINVGLELLEEYQNDQSALSLLQQLPGMQEDILNSIFDRTKLDTSLLTGIQDNISGELRRFASEITLADINSNKDIVSEKFQDALDIVFGGIYTSIDDLINFKNLSIEFVNPNNLPETTITSVQNNVKLVILEELNSLTTPTEVRDLILKSIFTQFGLDTDLIKKDTRDEIASEIINDTYQRMTMDEDLQDIPTLQYQLDGEIKTTVFDENGNEVENALSTETKVILEGDGSYTVTNDGFTSLNSLYQVKVEFNYKVNDGSDTDNLSEAKTVTLNFDLADGKATDGHVAGALVFADENGNFGLDEGELFTYTNDNGDFNVLTFKDSTAPLVAKGGTDISTGLAFEGILKAPAGSTILSPLTTLVQTLVENGNGNISAEEAETAVKKSLGIDNSVDLKTFDSYGIGKDENASDEQKALATAVQKVAVQVATIISLSSDKEEAINSLVSLVDNLNGNKIDLLEKDTLIKIVGNDEAASKIFIINTAIKSEEITDVDAIAKIQVAAKDFVIVDNVDNVVNVYNLLNEVKKIVEINKLPEIEIISTQNASEDLESNVIRFKVSDIDGTELKITAEALNGTATVNKDNTITYISNTNYNGNDTITIIATDDDGAVRRKEVSIVVDAENDAPTVKFESEVTMAEEGFEDIRFELSDIDGDEVKVVSISSDNGFPQFVSDIVEFSPSKDFTGKTTIEVKLTDGTVDITKTINVNVTNLNDAPTIETISTQTVEEDGSKTITFTASDIDEDTLTSSVEATDGTAEIIDGNIVFKPAKDFNGTATVTLTVIDGNGGEVKEVFDVTVTPINDAPTIETILTQTVDEDGTKTITFKASDIDDDTLTPSVTAKNGTAEIIDGNIVFKPTKDFNETAIVTLTVKDGNGGEVKQTFDVTVSPVNDAPVITALNQIGNKNSDKIFTINTSDIDNDEVTATVQAVANGTATIDGNTVTYTPNADFVGQDTITIAITDGNIEEPITKTITIDVLNANNNPEVFENQLSNNETIYNGILEPSEELNIEQSYALKVNTAKFILGVTDKTEEFTNDNIVSIVVNTNGNFDVDSSYFNELAKDEILTISFDVEITDSEDKTVTKTITLKVTGTNDLPVVEDVSEVFSGEFSEINSDQATKISNMVATYNDSGNFVATLSDGSYIYAYTNSVESSDGFHSPGGNIYIDKYNNGKEIEFKEVFTSENIVYGPSIISLSDDTIYITWTESIKIDENFNFTNIVYSQKFDSDGNSISDKILVSELNGFGYFHETLELSDGNLITVWNDGEKLIGQKYSPFGDVIGSSVEIQSSGIDLLHNSIDIVITGNNSFVVALPIYNNELNNYEIQLVEYDSEFSMINTNSLTLDENSMNISTNLVKTDNNYLLTWENTIDGNEQNVLQILDFDLQPISEEIIVNTNDTSLDSFDHLPSTTVLENGDILVFWINTVYTQVENGVDQLASLFYKRLDFEGNIISDKTLVHSTNNGILTYEVETLSDGEFLVNWFEGYMHSDTVLNSKRFDIDGNIIDNQTNFEFKGTLNVSDVDTNDTHTFEVVEDSIKDSTNKITALGVIINTDGTYTVSGNAQSLALDETAEITFDYVAIDSSSGQSEPATVTLKLTGTNDAPVVEDIIINNNPTILEKDGIASVYQGEFKVNDVDSLDIHTFSVVENSVKSSSSKVADLSVTVNNDGTYSVLGNFDALAADETTEVTFSYIATDSSGGVSQPATVSLKVTGTNDLPVVEDVIATYEGEFNLISNSEQAISNVEAAVNELDSVVLLSNGNLVYAYADETDTEIFIDMYDKNGNEIEFKSVIKSETTVYDPSLTVTSDGGFIVTYTNDDNIYVQKFDANADKIGNETLVSNNHEIERKTIELSDGSYVVTWEATNGKIFAQKFNSENEKVGEIVDLNIPSANLFSYDVVANNNNGFVLTYAQSIYDVDTNNSSDTVNIVEFDSDLIQTQNVQTIESRKFVYGPSIDLSENGDYLLTWNSSSFFTFNESIIFQKLDSSLSLNTITSVDTSLNDVTSTSLTNGEYLISWITSDFAQDLTSIHFQKFDSSGNKIGTEITAVNEKDIYGHTIVSFDNGEFMLTWNDSFNTSSGNVKSVVYDTDLNIADKSIDFKYSGQLDVTDIDFTDTHTFQIVENSIKDSTNKITGLSVVINNDGTYEVIGNAQSLASNETAEITFDYTSTDSSGGLSQAATVTLNVTGINDAPVAIKDEFTFDQYSTLELTFEQLLANDVDVDKDTLNVTAVSNPTNGTVGIIDGKVVFTPNKAYAGNASFDYTISDGTLEHTQTVALTINEVPTYETVVEGQITYDILTEKGIIVDDQIGPRATAFLDTQLDALYSVVDSEQYGAIPNTIIEQFKVDQLHNVLDYKSAKTDFSSDVILYGVNNKSKIESGEITVEQVAITILGFVQNRFNITLEDLMINNIPEQYLDLTFEGADVLNLSVKAYNESTEDLIDISENSTLVVSSDGNYTLTSTTTQILSDYQIKISFDNNVIAGANTDNEEVISTGYNYGILQGTNGNDSISLDNSLNSIDAKEGEDTLDLSGYISEINISNILDNVSIYNIESIDMTSDSSHILSNFTLDEFVALTDEDNTLKIFGDDADSIVLDSAQNWTQLFDTDNTTPIKEDGLNVYTTTNTSNQTLKLLIEDTITVNEA